MLSEFSTLAAKIENAQQASQLFGPLDQHSAESLRQCYRSMLLVLHPDHNPNQQAKANRATASLQEFYRQALREINGEPDDQLAFELESPTKVYRAFNPAIMGDMSVVYRAESFGEPVLLKISHHAADNDLMSAEVKAYELIDQQLNSHAVRAHYPQLREHFPVAAPGEAPTRCHVLSYDPECVSLAQVLQAYPNGIDLADAAWMFRRMLTALACVHDHGLVHGAITLDHVLINPNDHNGMLIDWCYSVASGQYIRAISGKYQADYAPELLVQRPAVPASDLYMASRCLVHLLGGDGSVESLPAQIPAALRALLKASLIPSPHRRIDNAWQLYDDFSEILQQRYGKPRFREFHMPKQ
jgi:serine/threonine protein kinase